MICEFYLNKTVIKIKNVKGICYGLDRKCPPKSHVSQHNQCSEVRLLELVGS
jgi:hypothetical protein